MSGYCAQALPVKFSYSQLTTNTLVVVAPRKFENDLTCKAWVRCREICGLEAGIMRKASFSRFRATVPYAFYHSQEPMSLSRLDFLRPIQA